ncbi:MAG: hypothetical protein M3116_05525, partial [Actinomycetota bacterium]|nr:hypothetical protein [Actinomycetota bacterium]
MGFHKPGSIGESVKCIYENLRQEKFHADLAVADRIYNSQSVENFQAPLLQMGHDFAFDYKRDQLGKKDYFRDYIPVDGDWYLNHMPKAVQD